ncbi:ATP-dependent helicase, partial [bacterium]|nr:ATP-dependent helicase [bacterium]
IKMTQGIEQTRVITPNEKQMECIKTIDGPVMVLAGPGTGKTFTVVERIKYMLQNGIMPESILCLTYSDAAANEMKKRIVSSIGAIAGAVSVHTYHSFCNDIIRLYPSYFEMLEGVRVVDDITKRAIMMETVKEYKPKYYVTKWGNAYYFVGEHLDNVNDIKSSLITKEEYFDILAKDSEWAGKLALCEAEYNEAVQKGKITKKVVNNLNDIKLKIEKAKEAWDIYELYDVKLKQKNFIDFNDMINMVVKALDGNESLLSAVSKQYKYFLVDEYQDTNYSQNNIVFTLAQGANTDNIMAVGDDDQIIYEFQGAKRDTLAKFLDRYPNSKVICLKENNRSTQNILDFSYSVISQDKTRLENNKDYSKFSISKQLIAKNPNIAPLNKKIQLHGFADKLQENNYIVDEIQKLRDSNPSLNLSDIAILVRRNVELNNFVRLLQAKNIPFQLKTTKSIFEINATLLIYFYLKVLLNHELYSDKLFSLLLSEPFSFDIEDYNFLLYQNRLNHKDFIFNIRENISARNWANVDKIKKFIDDFDYLKKFMTSDNIVNLLVETVNRTGILNYYVNNDINKSENIYAIKKIIDEAQGCMYSDVTTNLYKFLEHIDLAFESDIPIRIDKDEYTQNAVQLLTLHGSKGREFEYVFIPNLVAASWEKMRDSNRKSLPLSWSDINSDEESSRYSADLRVLFVGITRAKHFLCLSYPWSIDGKPQELTLYLSEPSSNTDIVDTYNHEMGKDDYENEIVSSIRKPLYSYKNAFIDELKARINELVLSPTELNNYLNCPRSFLYSSVLKIPVFQKDNSNAVYGSAVHSTLQLSVNIAKQQGNYPPLEKFLDIFKQNLDKQKLNDLDERVTLTERGINYLTEYYKSFVEVPAGRIYATEYKLDNIPYENFYLKGFIDRIEINSDGSFELYDYKTGTAKSKTQISDGGSYEGYLNQLRFYKFAFERFNPKAKVIRAGLIYPEDFLKNFYIELTDDDNNIIEDKISSVRQNIINLNFEPVEKCDEHCKYCQYSQMCDLNIF